MSCACVWVRRARAQDDYLCGPLTVDTYMCYRVRPTITRLQYKVARLVWRLSAIEISGFFVQASGSIFAIFYYNEWVALTVAVAAVLQGFIECAHERSDIGPHASSRAVLSTPEPRRLSNASRIGSWYDGIVHRFMALRNQVTAGNLALRDLQALTVQWDSLSIVRRRTPAIKMQIVSATEEAILMFVQERTTAASNTITSVGKQMEAAAAAEAAEAE